VVVGEEVVVGAEVVTVVSLVDVVVEEDVDEEGSGVGHTDDEVEGLVLVVVVGDEVVGLLLAGSVVVGEELVGPLLGGSLEVVGEEVVVGAEVVTVVSLVDVVVEEDVDEEGSGVGHTDDEFEASWDLLELGTAVVVSAGLVVNILVVVDTVRSGVGPALLFAAIPIRYPPDKIAMAHSVIATRYHFCRSARLACAPPRLRARDARGGGIRSSI
jgi:hypothetical protein